MSTGNSELFGAMLQSCGLSFEAAAELLAVDADVIMVWFSGSQQPAETAMWKLAEFARFQSEIADELLETWRKADSPARIKYGVSVSNAAARTLGWPSRDAQVAAVAKAQVALAPVMIDIVPMPVGSQQSEKDSSRVADHAA